MTQFKTPLGTYDLNRYPMQKKETLRAWDAADEYLLQELGEVSGRVLLINDSFGALCCALSNHRPVVQSDSWTALNSCTQNLRTNQLDVDAVSFISPLDPHQGHYDWVIVRVTKTLALLEHQLRQLRPHLHRGCRIIGLGMSKQIHTSTLQLFERLIGPTKTSLARKKARLIYAEFDPAIEATKSPYPVRYQLEGSELQLVNHANVFSREQLDIGTRFFLQHIPGSDISGSIVDLGCGNGVVGMVAAQLNPRADIIFTDESYMARASAEEGVELSGLQNSCHFPIGDCLEGVENDSVELILCNPPFHQQQVVGDAVAWRMFQQSYKRLKSGGELRIVGNRHLGYHTKLKRLFGNQRQIATNRKFVVLSARKE